MSAISRAASALDQPDEPFATGLGTISCADGTEASFGFAVAWKPGSVTGEFAYSDPASGTSIVSVRIMSLAVSRNTARFTGSCGRACTFTVTAVDGGVNPEDDTFAIRLRSYSAGPTPLSSGEIVVRGR